MRALNPLQDERTPAARLRSAAWKLTGVPSRVALAALVATFFFVGVVSEDHGPGWHDLHHLESCQVAEPEWQQAELLLDW